MFYWLTAFSDGGDIFNLFRYQTVRAGGAFLTALIFGFVFGRPLIDLLRRKQKKGQPIREDVGRYAFRGGKELGVAALPVQQVAQDDQRPAIPDEIEAGGNRTTGALGMRGHALHMACNLQNAS